MDDMWKRLLTVLCLSLLLPQLVLLFGSKYYAMVPDPEPTVSPQPTAVQTLPQQERILIPVLMSENLVMQMELEDYVRGVVLAEMPTSFDSEALKAQAVAARTYALRRVTLGDRHPLGAVCIDPSCCQAWLSDEDYLDGLGYAEDVRKAKASAEATAGVVVTYEGELAETTYFSCSGGRTESAEAVWNAEIPYLQAVDSPEEDWAAAFSSQWSFTAAEFSACLERNLTGSPTHWFGKETRTEGGGVATLVIGGISYSGVELRSLLGLPSTVFSVDVMGEQIVISARGHGHRVGLSQYGAGTMAQQGRTYAEILTHYYPGTDIDKWERIG